MRQRQAIEQAGDQFFGRRRAGDRQTDRIPRRLNERRHRLRAGLIGQFDQQILIDRRRAADQRDRFQPRRQRIADIQHSARQRRLQQGERIVRESQQHLGRDDQAMRIDANPAAAAVFPTGGHGPRDAERPARQRMEVVAHRLRPQFQKGIVRRTPNGQLPRILVVQAGTPGDDLIAGPAVGNRGSVNRLFDGSHAVRSSVFRSERRVSGQWSVTSDMRFAHVLCLHAHVTLHCTTLTSYFFNFSNSHSNGSVTPRGSMRSGM